MRIKFNIWDCELVKQQYHNGKTALELVAAEDDEENDVFKGEPIATATINIPVILEHDEVLIKNYSENEGMLEALVDAGVVKPTGRVIQTGFVEVPVCKLLV